MKNKSIINFLLMSFAILIVGFIAISSRAQARSTNGWTAVQGPCKKPISVSMHTPPITFTNNDAYLAVVCENDQQIYIMPLNLDR